MKFLKDIKGRHLFTFSTLIVLLLIAWGILIYYPALTLKFSLIDDGYIVKNARQFFHFLRFLDYKGLYGLIFEPQNGRVHPFYWILTYFNASAGFYKPFLVHMIRLSVLVVSMAIANSILKNLRIDLIWRVLSIGIFIMNIDNFENYYRLGPPEPLQILFYLFILVILFNPRSQRLTWKSKVFLALVSFLGSQIKETFLVLAFPSLGLLITGEIFKLQMPKNMNQKLTIIFLTMLFSGLLIFWVKNSYPKIGDPLYSSNYELNLAVIKYNLASFSSHLLFTQNILIYAAALFSIVFVFNFVRKRNTEDAKQVVFIIFTLLSFLANVAILTPWIFPLGRYLILANLNLMLLYPFLFQYLYRYLYKNISRIGKNFILDRRIASFLPVFMMLPFFFVRNIFAIANYQQQVITGSESSYQSIALLAKNVDNKIPVVVNYKKGDTNIEIYLETAWHLEEFYKKDVRFDYLTMDSLCTKETRYIFDRTSDRLIDKELLINSKSLDLIDKGNYSYKPINYGVVARSFIFGYRLDNWRDEYVSEWFLYKQKPDSCINGGNNNAYEI